MLVDNFHVVANFLAGGYFSRWWLIFTFVENLYVGGYFCILGYF